MFRITLHNRPQVQQQQQQQQDDTVIKQKQVITLHIASYRTQKYTHNVDVWLR